MPELPKVQRTVEGLSLVLGGHRITHVDLFGQGLRYPFPKGLAKRLNGAKVISLGRHGKYGLINTDRDDTVVFHLGMTGQWRFVPDKLQKQDHVVLAIDNGKKLVLTDPRRFGMLDIVKTNALSHYQRLADLGPDPLGSDFTADYLYGVTSKRNIAIKNILLDQKAVAGLGNIYACETLYRARIAPERRGKSLSEKDCKALVDATKHILTAAIKAGGNHLNELAGEGNNFDPYSKHWKVYGREGEPCKNGGVVQRRVDAGRPTFYCATWQE